MGNLVSIFVNTRTIKLANARKPIDNEFLFGFVLGFRTLLRFHLVVGL